MSPLKAHGTLAYFSGHSGPQSVQVIWCTQQATKEFSFEWMPSLVCPNISVGDLYLG